MSWQIDLAHSHIDFSVRHLMIAKVRGTFEKFSGTFGLDVDHLANTTVDVEIDAASISTREPKRDEHLKSPDFFNVEKFPVLNFKSSRVEITGDKNFKLFGDLTIIGNTKPVVLDVEYYGMAKSPWGATSAGFSGKTKINRKDWGLNWNQALEAGGVLVGDDVEVNIELELIQQPD